MGKIFNLDGPFMTAMTKLFDILILSLVWILFSIPVITIGASTTALYYTAVKGIRRNRGYVFKNFWKSFKLNFLPATVMWVMILIVDYIIWFNYANIGFFGGVLVYAIYLVDIIMLAISMCFTLYVFPILSRFNLTKKQLITTSMTLAIRHLPWTIVMLVIFAGTLLAANYLLFLFPPVLLLLPGVSGVLYSFPMEKVLKQNTSESDENPIDDWYME